MHRISVNPRYTLVLWLVALAACSSPEKNGVDQVLFNAKAYTLEATAPWAEAVAIQDNLIVYVGNNEGALALSGENTTKHDLDGQLVYGGAL